MVILLQVIFVSIIIYDIDGDLRDVYSTYEVDVLGISKMLA